MRTSALFGEKRRIFRNLWCVRTDKGGGSQFFAILCERLLWTAPKNSQLQLKIYWFLLKKVYI